MALDRKLITLTAPVATGVQTYSGVGFQGKVVLFLCACAAADGTHSSLIACCGMATGSGTGNQWVLAAASTEFNGAQRLAASDAGQSHADTHCVCMLASGAPTIMKEANFSAWTSDGFSLNWTVADATANLKVFALVLGGSDLTNVKVGRFNPPTAAGTQALTGFGFQPDCFGVVAPTSTSTNLTGENAADAHFNFGAAVRGVGTAVAAQATAGYFENGGAAAMDVQTAISTAFTIYTNSSATASNPQYRGSVQSFDTDGVTLNWAATTTTANRAMWYFAFKGPQVQIVADTQPTTNSTKSTPVAFPPKALILAGTHLTADGTSIAAGTQGYFTGMTDGTGQAAIGGMQEDANVDSWAKRRQAATRILSYIKSTTATVAGEAAVTLTGAGFDLAWTSVDAVARRFIGLAMGDAAGGGTTVVGQSQASTWHTRASISQSRAGAWHVYVPTGQGSRAGAWHVRAPARADQAAAWHTRSVAAQSRASAWHLRTLVAQSRASEWHARALVAQSQASAWNTRAAVAASRAAAWHVRALIAQSRAAAWHVQAVVLQERQAVWNVLSHVLTARQDQAAAWHVRAAVQEIRAAAWHIRAAVLQQRASAWHLRQAIATERASAWHIATLIAATRASAWHVRALAGAEQGSAWRVATQFVASVPAILVGGDASLARLAAQDEHLAAIASADQVVAHLGIRDTTEVS